MTDKTITNAEAQKIAEALQALLDPKTPPNEAAAKTLRVLGLVASAPEGVDRLLRRAASYLEGSVIIDQREAARLATSLRAVAKGYALMDPQQHRENTRLMNFATFDDWWDRHGKYNAADKMAGAGGVVKDLMRLSWEVSRETKMPYQPTGDTPFPMNVYLRNEQELTAFIQQYTRGVEGLKR